MKKNSNFTKFWNIKINDIIHENNNYLSILIYINILWVVEYKSKYCFFFLLIVCIMIKI